MKKSIFIILFLFLMTSCKSLTHKDYTIQLNNENKLPPLEAIVNMSSLESVFSMGTAIAQANNIGTQIGNNGWVQTGNIAATSYKDVRIQDTITLFDDFVKNHVTDPYGPSKGYITLKIGYRNAIFQYKNIPLLGLTLLSLGTLNFLGFPGEENKQEMQISVEIFNKNKELIKRYSSVQDSSAWIAMYWGYDIPTVERKVVLENITKALTDIGNQINNDAKELNKKLK